MKTYHLTSTEDLERMLNETEPTPEPISTETVTEEEFELLLSVIRKNETRDQRDERIARTYGTRVLEPRERDHGPDFRRSVIL